MTCNYILFITTPARCMHGWPIEAMPTFSIGPILVRLIPSATLHWKLRVVSDIIVVMRLIDIKVGSVSIVYTTL